MKFKVGDIITNKRFRYNGKIINIISNNYIIKFYDDVKNMNKFTDITRHTIEFIDSNFQLSLNTLRKYKLKRLI